MTWHELAWHGVHVRGPALEHVDVWTDTDALQAYSQTPLYRASDLTYRTDAGRGVDEEVEDLIALLRGRGLD